MPRTGKVRVKCPTCKQRVALRSEDFPFCSERCRLIDLGMWASGKHVVSSPVEDISDLLEHPDIRKNEDE